MKQLLSILYLLFLMSCSSTMDENFITRNEDELLLLVQAVLKSKSDTFNAEDDLKLSKQMNNLGIEKVVIRYKRHLSDFIQADSLVYFEMNDGTILEPQKNVVYDFSETPRRFGDASVVGASYDRIQVSDRWYYETIGFD